MKQTYQNRLDKLQKLAKGHHPEAQYLYAMASNSSLLRAEKKLSDKEVNHWLLQSAQNGYVDAQYMLGKNIIYGRGCKPKNQKGIRWLLHAAEHGHDKASRELYQLLKNNEAQSVIPAHHWLKMSAEAGNPESQLGYSQFLLEQGNPSNEQIAQIKSLLDNYSSQRTESVQWYLQMSRLASLEGNERKAQKYQKKADKLAKKLGWDMTLAMQ